MAENLYLVSAIVSTYKSEKFIRGKIEDLLNQSLKERLEIVIINSGSPQNEDAIIKEYLTSHSNIKYIFTEERESIYKAWNRAIRVSSGRFIANSNTDDRLREDAYEYMANVLIEKPEIALVYADQYYTNTPNQKFSEVNAAGINRAPEFNRLHQIERCLVGSQPMWRASLHFNDNIWFNEKYEVCGDHEFELNISQKYDMLHLPVILGTFYKCPDKKNKEYENPKQTMDEVYEITLGYLRTYIEAMKSSELENFAANIGRWIKFPVNISGLIKKINYKLHPTTYSPSLQFIYLTAAILREKDARYDEAASICKRFLSVRHSDRIQHYLNTLQQNKLSIRISDPE